MSYRIADRPIDPSEIEREVSAAGYGGVAVFLGLVRERSDDERPVTGLSYEAFVPMALHSFEEIATEARRRFGDVRIAIAHRVGELRVGEIAVVVAAGAPHRAAAFDACEYAIDELKRRTPIWKKEHYADGSAEWRENASTDGPKGRSNK
jgi:molybdopterin synthase catalytic subunit